VGTSRARSPTCSKILALLRGHGGRVYACSVLLVDDDDELAEVAEADETAFAASLDVRKRRTAAGFGSDSD
jgi:hypothetical protein